MKKGTLHIILFLMAYAINASYGQNLNVDQNVISSGGSEDTTATLIISSTIGESVVSTLRPNNTTSVFLTQGFQQYIVFDSTISFQLKTFGATCIGRSDGFAEVESVSGCNGPYTITWSNGDNGSSANNLAVGVYTVQITTAEGCSSMRTFNIDFVDNSPCLLKFYSGITPNNDGFNDQWEIDNINLFPNNKVNIYNRLGNRVWRGDNYDNLSVVWKGENLSGNELPSDTYFYVFENGSQIEKGWIELTR